MSDSHGSLLARLSTSGPGRRLRRLTQGSFARGLAVLTSATLLQNLITFGTAPIISRLFAPADFGVAGLIYAVSVVPVQLASGYYYNAIGIARSTAESVNLVFLSFGLVMLGTILAVPAALFLGANPQLLPDSLAGIAPYLWTLPAFVLANNLVLISRLWEVRHASYGPQVLNRLLEAIGIAVTQIGLGLFAVGPIGLILGRWMGAAAAGLHGLGLMLGRIGRRGLRSISRRRLRVLARRHWRFPVYGLPAAVLNGLTPQLTPILLGLFYSLDTVGFYWFASRLLERPSAIWGQNFARVFFQHAADRRKEGRPVAGLFSKSTLVLAASAALPFGVVIALGPWLFALIFGAEWETAGDYARWIAIAFLAFMTAFPARMVSGLFDLQRTYAIAEAIRAAGSALTLVVVALAGGSALLAIAAVSVAQGATMVGLIGYMGFRLRQLDRQGRQTRSGDARG